MKRVRKKRKGLSPIIATVLLIAMVIVIALIVFLWLRGLRGEAITKFGGTNIELICNDVRFEADYNYPLLNIINDGNVPIFKMNMKVIKEGSYETIPLEEFNGLNQGGIFTGDVSEEANDAEKIILIPILLGDSEKGKKAYVCNEQYGSEVLVY